jgi:trigger factor
VNTEASSLDESVELEKLNLDVDIKTTSACQRHVRVTIPREDIDRYFQKQFDDLAPHAELPGFRAGKAPRKLIESKFRKQVSERVKGALLMDSLAQINQGDHFSAISEPDLDYEQVNVPESGSMTFEFDIEVRPEFDLPNWKGLKINRPEHEFTEAEINDYIQQLGSEHADLVPVDGPVQLHDSVTCDITSSLDGKTVATHSEVELEVRPSLSFNDGTIEGFDKLVVGKRAGDKFVADFKVADLADNIEYQGKTLKVEFSVLDVKRAEPVDPATLAERYGVDSAEKFGEVVKSSLERQLNYEQHQSIRKQISETLTESANWELPPELLKRQFRRELSRALMELRSSGFSPDEIRARENMLRQDAMSRTEVLLKEHFILERIAEEQKIEDTQDDYDLEIARIAMSSGDSPRRVRSRLEKNGQIDVMRNMIIERKVIELIEGAAEFKPAPYKFNLGKQIEALDFSVSGDSEADIPEARYDAQPEPELPGQSKKDNA